MIVLGVVILLTGIISLIVTQIVLRKKIRDHKRSWEAQDEVY